MGREGVARGAVTLRAPTSPSSLQHGSATVVTAGPSAPANARSPRFSLDSRSSPRVPPGVRSPGGYPSLPSIHSSEIQPLPSPNNASPSSRLVASSRPAGESFKVLVPPSPLSCMWARLVSTSGGGLVSQVRVSARFDAVRLSALRFWGLHEAISAMPSTARKGPLRDMADRLECHCVCTDPK